MQAKGHCGQGQTSLPGRDTGLAFVPAIGTNAPIGGPDPAPG
jgi:hypothetical protein